MPSYQPQLQPSIPRLPTPYWSLQFCYAPQQLWSIFTTTRQTCSTSFLFWTQHIVFWDRLRSWLRRSWNWTDCITDSQVSCLSSWLAKPREPCRLSFCKIFPLRSQILWYLPGLGRLRVRLLNITQDLPRKNYFWNCIRRVLREAARPESITEHVVYLTWLINLVG